MKLKRSVFYSWQSDLPNNINRGFIENALKRAITAIGRDETAALEPVVDRDTAGVAGSPDIAISIFAKIASADVFVADVSIVNQGAGGRPTPNPNVLVELGYAVAELGWENIILVMNDVFGSPDVLPFDLRGRRVVVYSASAEADRAEARGLLQGRLEAGVRAGLGSGVEGLLPTGADADLWWGQWELSNAGLQGVLFVFDVGPAGFSFTLETSHGAHVGSLRGVARIVSKDLAYARIPEGSPDGDGELVFRRVRQGGRRVIEVEESISCRNFHGVRGFFGADYQNRPEPWFDRGLMTEMELSRLHSLVGGHLEELRRCSSDLAVGETYDEGPARVIEGGVAGLYTIMESIIIIGEFGRMCCAFLDGDVVRYFSNRPDRNGQRPDAVEQWRSRFADRQVVAGTFLEESRHG